jgi:hypothetical protein
VSHPHITIDDFEKSVATLRPHSQWNDILCSLSEVEVVLVLVMYNLEQQLHLTYNFEQIFDEYNSGIHSDSIPRYDRDIVEKSFAHLSECGVVLSTDSKEKSQRRWKMQLLPQQIQTLPVLCKLNCPESVLIWMRRTTEHISHMAIPLTDSSI